MDRGQNSTFPARECLVCFNAWPLEVYRDIAVDLNRSIWLSKMAETNKKPGIGRTMSEQLEGVGKEVTAPMKRSAIGRSSSEQMDHEATKEVNMISRRSSKGSISRTVSETENGMTVIGRKSSLGRKMLSPRVSGHIPKWKSGQIRIEDELSNAFFEEVALSRASSASLGLSFSIAGPVMAPQHGDYGLINDLQEARIHASMALNEKGHDKTDGEVGIKINAERPARDPVLPIFLKFSDVKYKVILKSKTSNFWRNSFNESTIFLEKEILHGVTGSVVPGEVLAMMGPSGSGKTTLINLLGGRMHHNVSGSITYNDQPYTKALKRRIGFVTQDDVLFPHLTVRETLTYAALLRLPNTLTKQQKEERAQEVIYELGLERCQDTIIGGAFVRGISGGERKRVCIGHEILIDPSLLFLDEPTSGLDSTTALRIIQMLHDIAQSGRTIVTTIHQPSSRLFHKFDKLILLGEGHSIYFGKASNAMDYFSSIGCAPLITMNPADFLLDLANANFQEVSIPPELQDKVQIEAVQAEIEGDLIPSGRPSPHDLLEYLVEAYETHVGPKEKEKLLELKEISDDWKSAVTSRHEWGATWWEQFSILFRRGLKERRHEYLSWLRVAQVLSTAILLGLLWWQSKINSPKGLQDQTGLLFFIAVFWGFFPVFTAIFTFPQERAMLAKERAVDMYRLSAYFIARNLRDLPLDLFLPIVYLLIVYFMAHLRMTVTAFFLTMLTVFLSIVASQGLGLAIGAAFMDLKKATTLASITMLTFMLAGGFFVQYGTDEKYDCSSPSGCKSIATSPSLRGIPLDGGMKEAGIMMAMVIGYRLLAYLSLRRMKLRV
eukprot:Gb_08303 [translate_table: standard]